MNKTTKLFKIPAKKFSIRYLYEFLIRQLQTGPYGWELVCDRSFPYGAVFKVPNFKEGEYGYAGLMYDEPQKGTSYWNWLKDRLAEEFIYGKEGLHLGRKTQYDIRNGVVYLYHKESELNRRLIYHGPVAACPYPYGRWKTDLKWNIEVEEYVNHKEPWMRLYLNMPMEYSVYSETFYEFSPTPEIFYRNAQVIFFSMFKQYEEEFDWKEQMGNYRVNYAAKPLTYYRTNQGSRQPYPSLMNPPVYPGTGCPALGAEPGFFQNIDGTVLLYLIRTKQSATVVVHLNDYWDYAQIGFFDAFQGNYEYAFPALAAASMSGVRPIAELFSYNSSPASVHKNFRFDFTQKNISMSHTIPPFSSTYWDGTENFIKQHFLSPVQAMIPDGQWRSFYNFCIRQDAFHQRNWGLFYESHKEPERIVSDYFLLPTSEESQGMVNRLPTMLRHQMDHEITLKNIEEMAKRKNCEEYNLQPLYLGFEKERNRQTGILGQMPGLYYCSRPVTRYGLYKDEKDGRLYLILPNCHERRRWTYKSFYSVFLGDRQSNEHMVSETARLDRMSESMNLAIELGNLEEETK